LKYEAKGKNGKAMAENPVAKDPVYLTLLTHFAGWCQVHQKSQIVAVYCTFAYPHVMLHGFHHQKKKTSPCTQAFMQQYLLYLTIAKVAHKNHLHQEIMWPPLGI